MRCSMIALAAMLPAVPASAKTGAEAPFADATTTHVPAAPDLHALDAALGDYDGDGDLDVAVAVEYGVNRLYLNDGGGRLREVEGALGRVAHDSEHVRAADFDGDGRLDLIFVAEDGARHQLFLGRPGGRFLDASDRLPATSEGNALAVGDVNGDGRPDIVVGNSAEGGGGPARNFLWLNDPRRPGHFRDAGANLPTRPGDEAQGIALADIDGDGDLDMVVANQTPANRLLLNDGAGRFTDASERLDQPVRTETREVHVFDADRDGRPDLLFLNLTSNNKGWDKDPQSRLLIQQADGRFRDETAARLPRHRFSSWGGQIVDFDGDGAPDIVVSAIQVPGFVPEQLRAWRNDGRGRFVDATLTAMPATAVGRSWSIAKGDLDGDRRDDLFVGQWGTQARLLLTDKAAVDAARPPAPELGRPVR